MLSCTAVKLRNQFSQGSKETDLRCGGRFYSSFFCSSSENAVIEELLKLDDICKSYCTFLWTRVYVSALSIV